MSIGHRRCLIRAGELLLGQAVLKSSIRCTCVSEKQFMANAYNLDIALQCWG